MAIDLHDAASVLDRSAPASPVHAAVRASLVRLVERFRPASARGVDATWAIAVHGMPTWTIEVRDGRCSITPGSPATADARLETDPETWLEIVDGSLDAIRAFMAGDLQVQGDLNLATRLETLFVPGPLSTRMLHTRTTTVKGVRINSLVAGHGTPVLLLHGLAASKVSFLPTLDGLSDRYEVHALDLPGFGDSDKPLPLGRRYRGDWMADLVHGYLVRNGLGAAHVVGNSMGGGIATELAVRHPDAVRSITGLGSAMAFDEWQVWGRVLRLAQMQWAGVAFPSRIRLGWLERGISELFHDSTRMPTANIRAAARDTQIQLQDPRYRLAVAACSRHIIDRRADDWWDRLADLRVPSLWIHGRQDVLVSARYAERIRRQVRGAEVQVWDGMGHVPQFEDPERTNTTIAGFLRRVEAGRLQLA